MIYARPVASILLSVLANSISVAHAADEKLGQILPNTGDALGRTSSVPLPTGNLRFEILPKLVQILLAMVGTVSLCIFIYAGIMLLTAQGNEEQFTKFKNTLIWSAVGLAFITTAYGLVTGILNISFK